MTRVSILVAACVITAAGGWGEAQALPYAPGAAAAATPLVMVRYHRHRHRHYARREETSPQREETGSPATASDDEAIKSGQWEFAAQIDAAALPSAGTAEAPAGAGLGGGATKSTYAICVAPDKAIPSAFVAGCQLDAVHRDGGRITWSMTCTNPQSAVRSAGVAQYRGDTMSATMVSHLPNGKTGGKTTDVAQYISGHYVGPCPSTTTADANPSANAAGTAAQMPTAANVASGRLPSPRGPAGASAAAAASAPLPPPARDTSAAAPPSPPAASNERPAATASLPPPPTNETAGAAAPSSPAVPAEQPAGAATPTTTSTAAPSPATAPAEGAASAAANPETTTASPAEASPAPSREEHASRHRRHGRHRRHYAHRRRGYGGYYGGGFYGNGTYSGFGPNPYSANGY